MALVETFLKDTFEKYISRTKKETTRALSYKTSQLQIKCKELKDSEKEKVELVEKVKVQYLQRETVLVRLLRNERMRVKLMEKEIELLNKSDDINDEIMQEVEQLVAKEVIERNVDFAIINGKDKKFESYKEKPVGYDIDEATDDEEEFFTGIKEINKELVVSVNETSEIDHQNIDENPSDPDLEAQTKDITEHLLDEFVNDRDENEAPNDESNKSTPHQSQLLPNFSQFDDQSDISIGCELEPAVATNDSRIDMDKDNYIVGKRKRKETKPYAMEIMKEYHSGGKRIKSATKNLVKVNTSNIVARKRKNKSCGACKGCLREECEKCRNCKDKPKFGGENKIKQKCLERQCLNIVLAR